MMQSFTNPRCLFFTFVLVLGSVGGLFAQAQNEQCTDQGVSPSAVKMPGLKPLLLFTQYSVWSSVVGSDTPTLAVYEDGTTIYWQGDRQTGKYVSAHLSSTDLKNFLDKSQIAGFKTVKPCYSLTEITDQPTNVVTYKTDEGYRTISVYGSLRGGFRGEKGSDELPLVLQNAFTTFLAFSRPDARPWQPQRFEVIIWPFDYAKGKTIAWPASWPGLSDPHTVHRKSSDSLYLPISDLPAFQALTNKMPETQALLLDGRKWACSARFPFPHELPLDPSQ